jgi:GNAT superfamily N-acetyltransferase
MEKSEIDKKRIISEIEITELAEGDLGDIAMLIQEMHPTADDILLLRSHTTEYYHWMYFENPTGRAHIFGARHNNKLISCFALAPKLFQVDNHEFCCGKTMDMFTHPNYQGLGLMNSLASRVFEQANRSGIKMWYVTPSKNSYPIFLNKWKYIESFELTYMLKVLNHAQLFENLIKPHFVGRILGTIANISRIFEFFSSYGLNDYEISSLKKFGEETDELWKSFRLNYKVIQIRNANYLNWRYVANPDPYPIFQFKKNGVLRGVIVLKHTIRNGLKVGEIVDYLYLKDDRQIFRVMVSWAIKQLRQDGCVAIQSWTIDSSAIEKEIYDVGLKRKRKRLKILLSPGVPLPEFYDKAAWFISQGDGNDI